MHNKATGKGETESPDPHRATKMYGITGTLCRNTEFIATECETHGCRRVPIRPFVTRVKVREKSQCLRVLGFIFLKPGVRVTTPSCPINS